LGTPSADPSVNERTTGELEGLCWSPATFAVRLARRMARADDALSFDALSKRSYLGVFLS